MAKQKGAIQLAGKLDDLCYYQKKYTQGGLVRRINQAMSQRLKDDPVFENTRKANSVFGMCSMLAGTFFEAFGLGLREMQFPAVQAKMTRACLNAFRMQSEHNFGNEFEGSYEQAYSLAHAFNSLCLNRGNSLLSFLPAIVNDDPNGIYNTVLFPESSLRDFCLKNKCNSLGFRVYRRFDIDYPRFDLESQSYVKGFFYKGFLTPFNYWSLGDGDLSLDLTSVGTIGSVGYVLVVGVAMNKNSSGNYTRLWRSSFYKLLYNDA